MVVAHRGVAVDTVRREHGVRAALIAGALVGVVTAAIGVLSPHRARLPRDAAAMVGSVEVSRAEYERALAGVAGDRRAGTADAAIRRRVLERLIDEAVLVDHGLAQGIVYRDPRLRTELSATVIDSVLSGDDPPRATPDEAAMRAFYTEHAGEFAAGDRIHAARLLFHGADAEARARDAVHRLANGAAVASLRTLADADPAPPPDGPVSDSVLARYVGVTMANALAAAPVGRAVGPLTQEGGGFAVGAVLARTAGAPPGFEHVRDAVAAEMRRRDDDARLRRWLDARRREIPVVRAEDLR